MCTGPGDAAVCGDSLSFVPLLRGHGAIGCRKMLVSVQSLEITSATKHHRGSVRIITRELSSAREFPGRPRVSVLRRSLKLDLLLASCVHLCVVSQFSCTRHATVTATRSVYAESLPLPADKYALQSGTANTAEGRSSPWTVYPDSQCGLADPMLPFGVELRMQAPRFAYESRVMS